MDRDEMMREQERRDWALTRRSMYERQTALIRTMVTLMFVGGFMAAILTVLAPATRILERYEEKLAAEVSGMKAIPSLQAEIAVLQRQLSAMTTESIEARIATIEDSIRVGTIDPSEVVTVQNLTKDFQILKTYMFRDPTELVDLKQLQKNYHNVREMQDKFIRKDVAMREISFLQNLFYGSIGLFSLLLAVMGGSWWQSARRLRGLDERLSSGTTSPEN